MKPFYNRIGFLRQPILVTVGSARRIDSEHGSKLGRDVDAEVHITADLAEPNQVFWPWLIWIVMFCVLNDSIPMRDG